MRALEDLKEGHAYIRMLHRREPCHLFPILEKNNFFYTMTHSKEGLFTIWICRKDDAACVEYLTQETGKQG